MKHLLSILSLLAFSVYSLFAQTIVGTDPENKNVILEDFTGINCPNCPSGHAIAQAIYDAHPDDVVLVNIHTGGYANPSGNQPDYRTQWGSAIAGQTDLQGYPAGTVNRHLFPGWSQPGGSGTAMSRSRWTGAANQMLAEPSYLNVGVEATIVTSTRQLVVYVEVYYTDDSPAGMNYLNVAIMQNNIVGYQSGGGANYNHMHMLRHLLTGQWGVEITETTQGSLYTGTFTYELPEDYRDVDVILENLDIAAFVTESHQEVISGNMADITLVESYDYDAAINFVNIPQIACSGEMAPIVLLKNYGVIDLTSLDFVYSINGGEPATFSWTGNLAQNETTEVTLPMIAYDATDNNIVDISCELPNDEPDELPQNDYFAADIPGSQTFPTDCYFGVQTLGNPQDITWSITDMDGIVVVEGGPYENPGLQLTEFNFPETGCYVLTLNDASGEALSGGFYIITDSDTELIWTGEDFTGVTVTAELAHGMIVDVPETIIADNITIYPNPVTQTANIELVLSNETNMEIAVLDMLGKNVMNLYEGIMNTGQHKIQFDASSLAQGIYFVKLQSNNEIITKKIMISK